MTTFEKTVRKISNSTQYSLDGLDYLCRHEYAARLEIYFAVGFLVLYLILGVSWTYILGSLILFAILLATEALNTAIEVIIDRISPEISPTGKHAKDLGSLAVMCLLGVNLVFAGFAISTTLSF